MLRVESCSIDAGLLGGDRGIFEGMGDKRSNINRGNGFANQTKMQHDSIFKSWQNEWDILGSSTYPHPSSGP